MIKHKKPSLVQRLDGIAQTLPKEEQLLIAIENIKAQTARTTVHEILLLGTCPQEYIQTTMQLMLSLYEKANPTEHDILFHIVKNPLYDAAAAHILDETKGVVLIEKRFVSHIAQIDDLVRYLKQRNIPVLGFIVLED